MYWIVLIRWFSQPSRPKSGQISQAKARPYRLTLLLGLEPTKTSVWRSNANPTPNGELDGKLHNIWRNPKVLPADEVQNKSKFANSSTNYLWLVVSTPLKNMSQNGFIFPKVRDEHKKCWKPSPRQTILIWVNRSHFDRLNCLDVRMKHQL